MPTEKETILREREAFVRGSDWRLRIWQQAYRVNYTQGEDEIAASQQHYPLPKVTRPRVWTDTTTEWRREFRFANSQLQTRIPGAQVEWTCLANGCASATTHADGLKITPARIKAWADLLANPTEEVEA